MHQRIRTLAKMPAMLLIAVLQANQFAEIVLTSIMETLKQLLKAISIMRLISSSSLTMGWLPQKIKNQIGIKQLASMMLIVVGYRQRKNLPIKIKTKFVGITHISTRHDQTSEALQPKETRRLLGKVQISTTRHIHNDIPTVAVLSQATGCVG